MHDSQDGMPPSRPRSFAGAMVMFATLMLGTFQSPAWAQDASNKYYQAAVAEARKIAEGQQLAPSLEMMGYNSGVEGQTLEQVYKAFTEGAGVTIKYTGAPDVANLVQSRVQAGTPPDVADLTLYWAKTYAKQGRVIDLSAAFGAELKDAFSPELLDYASYDGKVFGVYQGINAFMLWYNPQTYTGPKNPTNWQQIVDWTNSEVDKGNTPWCAAQFAGAVTGFPATSIIMNILLKKYGPETYYKLGQGELAWTSPEVKDAFEQFGAIFADDKKVHGGVAGMLSEPISTGYNGLTAEKPTCQMIMWGSWVPGLIGETAKPGVNIDFFRIPASDPKYADYEKFQSTVSVGFSDNPTTKAFLKFVASAPAQAYLASLNRWPVANKNVPSDVYPSIILQKVVKEYFASTNVKFAAGLQLLGNAPTQTEYRKGMIEYLQDPSQLKTVLQAIQDTADKQKAK